MTTDHFAEAARAEAARTYGHLPFGPMRSGLEGGHAHGAVWARTHLAAQEDDGHDGWCGCGCQDAQEPTDAEVEAAARAMRIETLGDTVRPGAAARWWDDGDVSPDEADKLRRLARAALSAARAVKGG